MQQIFSNIIGWSVAARKDADGRCCVPLFV